MAALIVPSTQKVQLFKEFALTSSDWPKSKGEVKGRLLNERQIAQTIRLLHRRDCLVVANVIDMGMHTDEGLSEFQADMCRQIAELASNTHPVDYNQLINETAAMIQKPRNPVFVEAVLVMRLVPRILNDALNYYARRIPKELKHFQWLIDGKDEHITEFEQAWYSFMRPMLAALSLQEPLQQLPGGDFTYFKDFYRAPEQLPQYLMSEEDYEPEDTSGVELDKVLGYFAFGDSKENIGLQLADIIANSIQRALNNRLREEGYAEIGRLMVSQRLGAVRMYSLDAKLPKPVDRFTETPFAKPLNIMLRHSKSMTLTQKKEEYLRKKFVRQRKTKLGYERALK